jgi:hypothetical protein
MIYRFEGHSDDTFGEYGVTNDDYDNCASGKPIRWELRHGEDVVIVFGQHCPEPASGWLIGVARGHDDDDQPLPDWPMRFERGEYPYSPALLIDSPEGTTLRCLERNEDAA